MTPHAHGLPDPARPLPDPVAGPLPVRPGEYPLMPGAGPRALVPVPPAPPGLTSGPDTRALLKALGRRWFLALFLGLLGAAGAGVAAWSLLSPKYTAFAQVRVAATQPWIFHWNADTPEGRTEFDTYKRFQASELKSRFVLNAALNKPEVKRLRLIREQPEPIPFLEDELKVQTKDGQEIVTVALTGTDPDEVVTLVRAVVQAYMDEIVTREQEDRKARVGRLELAYNNAREAVIRKQKHLQERAAQLRGSGPQGNAKKETLLLTSLADARKRHEQVQYDVLQIEGRLKAHQATEKDLGKTAVPELTLSQALDGDPVAKRLLDQIAQKQQIISEYERIVQNPNESTLVEARRAKSGLERTLARRKEQLRKALGEQLRLRGRDDYKATLGQLQAALAAARDQERILGERVQTLTASAEQLPDTSEKVAQAPNELDVLREDILPDQRLADEIAARLGPLRIEVAAGPRVTLYQPAGLQKTDSKRRIVATALAPVAALAGICFAVGWWEFRARRIQTADEVATGLGMRVVGAVPALAGPTLGRLAGDPAAPPDDPLVESIDAIRTMLLRDASVLATRVVMVTSAVGGEGKTTLASNLATSLARAGRKTLFIDCDLRCPAAHQLFEQTLQPGLSEILLGEVSLADAVRPTTALDGLWLLPAGQWDREVLRALARSNVHELFDRLRQEFDFIILDSHPVLPATDSLLIGQHADAVLLSLMRDVSQVPRVHAAGQRLAGLGIRVLGAVVHGLPGDACEHGYQPPVARAA